MIKNGLIVILMLLSVFLFSVKTQKRTITTTTVDTVTVTKTFEKYTKGDKIPFKVLDTIYETNHDTTFIVKDYSQVKEFADTIKQDSNIYVIRDTISQNRIIGRSFKAKVQEKTITITNNVEIAPKAALYLGIRSDIRRDLGSIEHNVSLSFKTRKKGLFNVGYGMSGYSIGYSIKL
jgi:hypothetical protein